MSQRVCHHIHLNGAHCQSPPITDRDYCHFHLNTIGRRMRMAKARAAGERWQLALPELEDLFSVQEAIMRVTDAVADDRIDLKRAQFLLSALRLAASNLRSEGWHIRRFEVDESTEMQLLEDRHFERNHGLPEGLDLSLAPDVAYPPPDLVSAASEIGDNHAEEGNHRGRQSWRGSKKPPVSAEVTIADIAMWREMQQASAAAARDAQQAASQALAKPRRGDTTSTGAGLRRRALELIGLGRAAQVTPFDVELMEIYDNQGEAAMIDRVGRYIVDQRRIEQRRKTRENQVRFAAEASVRSAANLAAHLAEERSESVVEPSPATATAKKPPQSEASMVISAATGEAGKS